MLTKETEEEDYERICYETDFYLFIYWNWLLKHWKSWKKERSQWYKTLPSQQVRWRLNQSVQLLSRVWHFATPWIAALQASLSITNSRSLLKLMSIESMMPSSHLILCRPLHLLPSISPTIRVFSNESILHMRWPKIWSFSFSISPSNEHPGLISFRMDTLDLLAIQGTLESLHRSYLSIMLSLRFSWVEDMESRLW